MSRQPFTQQAFDDTISTWLDERAGGPAPDSVVDRALARTSTTRPLPRWRLLERWVPAGLTTGLAPLRPVVVVAAVLLILAALAVFVVGSQRRLPPPFGLAQPGAVAFVADGQIWTADPDGSDRIQLTFDSRLAVGPQFSRDGTRIVFKRLSIEGSRPNWQEWGDVVVVDADGRNEIVLDTDGLGISPISWSGDGSFIVYSRIVDGIDQLIVAATDGSSTRVLTTGPDGNWAAALSPDGGTVAFVKGYPDLIGIYAISLDGTNERRLSTVPMRFVDGMDWSLDGRTLLFSAGDAEKFSEAIYAVGPDGPPEHVFTDRLGNDQAPAWSPDGTQVAFLAATSDQSTVMVAAADGSAPKAISILAYWTAPQWSPDGLHVLAVDARTGGGKPTVAILDPSGREPTTTFALPDVSGFGRADTPSWQRLAP